MSKAVYYALFALCVLVSSFAQILLKKSADRGYSGLRIFLNPETVIGYAIFLSVTFVIVLLYRYIELSAGTLIDSLGYVFITVLSSLILKERLTKKRILGISLILLGVTVYAVWGG